jgi:hypothetical protein
MTCVATALYCLPVFNYNQVNERKSLILHPVWQFIENKIGIIAFIVMIHHTLFV